MLVYKFIAMPADASYLFLSQDSAFSLTAEHGAKTLSEKRATYHVTHLEQEGKGKPAIPLADVKGELYLAPGWTRTKTRSSMRTNWSAWCWSSNRHKGMSIAFHLSRLSADCLIQKTISS